MKIIHINIILLLSFTAIKAQDSLQILFIGNSITYYNNMPSTFEAIANSQGDTAKVTMYAPGGTGFIHHVNDPNVYSHFRRGNWDYVVLQPGSNESSGYSEPITATIKRAKQLKDSILKYSPCAKILFYEITYGVWGCTAENIEQYNQTMNLIRKNLEMLADSTESFFAPAGEAIKAEWNRDQSVMFWGSTGDIHPNAIGSYIIACTFYASIFQKKSYGTNVISSLDTAQAKKYQKLADSTVLNHLTDWRINVYFQHTDFNFNINKNKVNFTNKSVNIDSLIWNFGDGNYSKLENPEHIYTKIDTYDVTLKTFKNGCTDSLIKNVKIDLLSNDEIFTTENIKIYPNPFVNKLIINCRNIEQNEIFIYNILGQNINKSIDISELENGIELNTSSLSQGIYLIKINNFSYKVIKN